MRLCFLSYCDVIYGSSMLHWLNLWYVWYLNNALPQMFSVSEVRSVQQRRSHILQTVRVPVPLPTGKAYFKRAQLFTNPSFHLCVILECGLILKHFDRFDYIK